MPQGLMERAKSVATTAQLPSTEQLLVADGDARIALDPVSGVNRYGCGLHPDPALAAFGSSTASVISQASFAWQIGCATDWQQHQSL